MICFVDEKTLPLLLQFLQTENNIYSCRIGCLLQSYGIGYDFALFYLQTDSLSRPVGAAVKYYADITVMMTEESDLSEWQEFIQMYGFASLLCSRPHLTDCCCEEGVVMTLTSPPEDTLPLPEDIQQTEDPNLSSLWQLLKSCEADDFQVPSYEDFLLDFSHKLRHNTAKCLVLTHHGQPAAAALTSALTDRSAIIGGVATDRHFRGQGLGSCCVTGLIRRLQNRTIFLMRDKALHERFYHALGFENTAPFYLIQSKKEKERTE